MSVLGLHHARFALLEPSACLLAVRITALGDLVAHVKALTVVAAAVLHAGFILGFFVHGSDRFVGREMGMDLFAVKLAGFFVTTKAKGRQVKRVKKVAVLLTVIVTVAFVSASGDALHLRGSEVLVARRALLISTLADAVAATDGRRRSSCSHARCCRRYGHAGSLSRDNFTLRNMNRPNAGSGSAEGIGRSRHGVRDGLAVDGGSDDLLQLLRVPLSPG